MNKTFDLTEEQLIEDFRYIAVRFCMLNCPNVVSEMTDDGPTTEPYCTEDCVNLTNILKRLESDMVR